MLSVMYSDGEEKIDDGSDHAAGTVLFSYLIFAGIAQWLSRYRESRQI